MANEESIPMTRGPRGWMRTAAKMRHPRVEEDNLPSFSAYSHDWKFTKQFSVDLSLTGMIPIPDSLSALQNRLPNQSPYPWRKCLSS